MWKRKEQYSCQESTINPLMIQKTICCHAYRGLQPKADLEKLEQYGLLCAI